MQDKYHLALHLLFVIVLQMRPLAQELHIDQLGEVQYKCEEESTDGTRTGQKWKFAGVPAREG
jgi:hypothetical protein